ncbi:glycosyltransferase family 2 protein [Sinimarinibacterium flocculans]|uniref:glycosyltransferase family 2 protein n=1 Tax=Sinimarinibacterium flocculans TaxID=985250 RepID=UPI002491E3AE|nr:glycosyltransferase [Sinimarinibacterium flocculans]
MNMPAPIELLTALRCPTPAATTTAATMRISVCIATYRRPERLRVLLDDLIVQRRPPHEVIVVDNDAEGSARAVVDVARGRGLPFALHYEIQPQKNVAITRNRSVALAQGNWLAFVDDDERAPPAWLGDLAAAAARFDADAVLGPVLPLLPDSAPPWLRRGRFYDWARLPTGSVVPVRLLRFGNVLLSAEVLLTQAQVFDPAYGLTGGEDGDLLARLTQAGARIVWCDEASVTEPVEAARMSLRWLLLRALRGGQDFARHVLAGRHGPATRGRRLRLLLRALLQMLAAGLLAVLCLPLGRHRCAHWLTKATANFGKLSAFAGLHYREYA